MVSFLVVATPHFLPCPVDPRTLADSPDPEGMSGQPRRRRRRIPRDEAGNDVMSEERQKMKVDEWATPKRECPVPKPGGLIGQVLGIKKDDSEEVEQPSITTQIRRERARRKEESDNEERA